MNTKPPSRLPERLRDCAQIWVDAADGTLAKLGRSAVNDSSFFNRLDSPQGVTTATLEKFARFFADPANWPDGEIPSEVQAFVHVTGITANVEQSSQGKAAADFPGVTGEAA